MKIPVILALGFISSTELTAEEVAEFLDRRSIALHGCHYIPEELKHTETVQEKFTINLFRALSHPCSKSRVLANFQGKSFNPSDIRDFVRQVWEQMLKKSEIPLTSPQ